MQRMLKSRNKECTFYFFDEKRKYHEIEVTAHHLSAYAHKFSFTAWPKEHISLNLFLRFEGKERIELEPSVKVVERFCLLLKEGSLDAISLKDLTKKEKAQFDHLWNHFGLEIA